MQFLRASIRWGRVLATATFAALIFLTAAAFATVAGSGREKLAGR